MKTEKKRSLKGAVLFTVVSVLAIMIIFMTCTLAMSAAANKRARKTYSTSQSSYTARTAIDSILAAVGTDKNFSKSIRDLKLGNEMDVIVELNNASMGSIDNAKIKYVGTKKVFDPDATVNAWVNRNLYEISADVTIGGETTTIKSNVLQDPPQPPGGGGGGAAFLTYGGGLDVGNFTGTWGGSYFGMGDWANGEVTKNWQTGLSYIEWNPVLSKMMLLTDKGYLTDKDYHFQNDNHVEAPFVVNGNFNVTNKLTVYYNYHASGVDNPGMQIWGDLNIDNNKLNLQATAKLKEYIKNNGYSFIDMPYLYVDGTIRSGNPGLTIGVGDGEVKEFNAPLNVFCGNMETNAGTVKLRADVYCMDNDKTTVFGDNGSNLYRWSNSVVNGGVSYSTLGGDFYSKGNVEVAGQNEHSFGGDVRIEGDLIVKSKMTVEGILAVGGNIKIEGGTLTVNGKNKDGSSKVAAGHSGIYAEHASGTGFTSDKGAFKADLFDTKEKEAVLAKSIKLASGAGANWAWVKSSAPGLMPKELNKTDLTKEDVTVSVYDFEWGSNMPALPDEYIIQKFDNEPDKDAISTAPKYQAFVRKGTDIEVPDSEAHEISNLKFNGKTVDSLANFKTVNPEGIYPIKAERETIMGAKWPVKGIENRVVVKPDDLDFSGFATYNQAMIGNGVIKKTCTLTGKFDKTIKIKPENGEEIYVQLKDVNFESPMITVDEKNVSSNTAKIEVDETDGKVHFVLSGNVESNYYYKDETRDTKLLKTVYDWMNEFALETVNEKPSSEPAPITGSASALEISENSTLKGDWNATTYPITEVDDPVNPGKKHRDITIKAPANGEIWITLDNFKTDNNVRIVVDDTAGGTVKFYIKGECKLGSGGGIVAKSFIDIQANDKFHIISHNIYKDQFITGDYKNYPVYKAPKIKVFAESGAGKEPKLQLENDAMITGYVHAINLAVTFPTVSDNLTLTNKIIYDGQPLESANPKIPRIGVVGMLDVKSCTAGNDWLLLYVDESDSEQQFVVDAEGKHTYSSVEYMAYAN